MSTNPATRLLWIICLLMMLLLPLAGCQEIKGITSIGSEWGRTVKAPESALESGAGFRLGGRIRLYGRNPDQLDPAQTQDVSTWQYVLHIFSGLVKLDNDLRVVPDAAVSWRVLNGGTTYRFTLRDDLRFHDGRPVTAYDFKYSLERATDPDGHSSVVYAYLGDIVGVADRMTRQSDEIAGVSVVDELTLDITIDAPKSYFLSKLTYPTAYVVDRKNVESGGKEWWRKPNGTGPFRLKEWAEEEYLILKRSDVYYGEQPYLDEVSYYLGGGSAMIMYERNELDVIEVGLGDIERVLDPRNPLNQELVVEPMLSLWYIGLNPNMPPFDDVKVRQAFNHAADRDRLVNITFKQTRLKASGVLPPGMPGYDESIVGLEFDPERARRLIAESKYGSVERLPEITLTIPAGGGSLSRTLAEMYHRNLGVRINVHEVGQGFYQDLEARAYQMFYMGWVADYPDPQNFLDVLLHSESPANYSGYGNPQADRLLERARVEPDVNERLKLYRQAERILVDDAIIVPLFHDVSYVLAKPWVHGLQWTPMGVLSFVGVSVSGETGADR